ISRLRRLGRRLLLGILKQTAGNGIIRLYAEGTTKRLGGGAEVLPRQRLLTLCDELRVARSLLRLLLGSLFLGLRRRRRGRVSTLSPAPRGRRRGGVRPPCSVEGLSRLTHPGIARQEWCGLIGGRGRLIELAGGRCPPSRINQLPSTGATLLLLTAALGL